MTVPVRFGCLMMAPAQDRMQWLEAARRVEGGGYSSLQVSDHFSRTPLSPLLALSAAAQVTQSIRLGTLVLDNDFRHPAVLAKEIATCDVLCDGRLEVGLGAGWMAEDYESSGIPFDLPGRRIDRLSQSIRILKGVLGSTGPQEISTTDYGRSALASVPLPRQHPHPPLLVGGGGPRILALAAREADIVGVNMMNREGRSGESTARSAFTDATDEKVALIRLVAAEHDRQVQLHLIIYWAEVTENPEEALARKQREVGIPIPLDELAHSPHCLVGPLSYLEERVAELHERWGISYLTLYDRDAAGCEPLLAHVAAGSAP